MVAEHPDEERIGAFVDGELAEDERQAVAAHLESCPSCAAGVEAMRALSRRIAAAGPAPLPTSLPARVRAVLAAEAAGGAGTDEPAVRPRRPAAGRMARLRENIAPLAACLVVTALLSSSVTWWVARDGSQAMSRDALVTHDLLTAHLRALTQDGAIQVASSDSHTVKPWFAGKVDFSPDAPDLAAEGFPLVGGRLDIVDGKRVGALVYRRRLHLVDVFAWPAPTQADAPPDARVERGYNIVTWSKGGVTYSAVSDLETAELERLAQLL
ncbi:anti-sigma factor family protein [Labrys monachus]|nr:anti-sigma factor [Labrys monachus]